MAGVNVCQNTGRQPRRAGGRGESFGAQGRLVGVLQQHHIPRHQGRNYRVDGREQRVVPGGQHQYDAVGATDDSTIKARDGFRHDVGKRRLRDGEHVTRTLLEASDLARSPPRRAPHLRCDLFGCGRTTSNECIDNAVTAAMRSAVGRPPANGRPVHD